MRLQFVRVKYKGKFYLVYKILYNGNERLFVIDEVDKPHVDKLPTINLICANDKGGFINGYPGYVKSKNNNEKKRQTTFVHSEILDLARDGRKVYLVTGDHINQVKTDNRRANLRAVSQTIQNINQGKKERQPNEILESAGIDVNDIPIGISLKVDHEPYRLRFVIEYTEGGKELIKKETTGLSEFNLYERYQITIKILLVLHKRYPTFFNNRNVMRDFTEEAIRLRREYNEIIMLSGFSCARSNLVPIKNKLRLKIDEDYLNSCDNEYFKEIMNKSDEDPYFDKYILKGIPLAEEFNTPQKLGGKRKPEDKSKGNKDDDSEDESEPESESEDEKPRKKNKGKIKKKIMKDSESESEDETLKRKIKGKLKKKIVKKSESESEDETLKRKNKEKPKKKIVKESESESEDETLKRKNKEKPKKKIVKKSESESEDEKPMKKNKGKPKKKIVEESESESESDSEPESESESDNDNDNDEFPVQIDAQVIDRIKGIVEVRIPVNKFTKKLLDANDRNQPVKVFRFIKKISKRKMDYPSGLFSEMIPKHCYYTTSRGRVPGFVIEDHPSLLTSDAVKKNFRVAGSWKENYINLLVFYEHLENQRNN
jgi:hypothetical protein